MIDKEYIKKGCDLIGPNHYHIHDHTLINRIYGAIYDIEDPLYIAFLQLVIEAINEAFNKSERGYYITQKHNGIALYHVSNLGRLMAMSTEFIEIGPIKAKENILSRVFEDMEATN